MNILFLLKPKSTIIYLPAKSTIRQGIEKFKAHSYTAVPVIDDDGKYLGTISEGDFLWNIVNENDFKIKDNEHKYIYSILRSNYNPPIKVDTTMDELFEKITNQNFVPVVDDRNFFVGIITRKDVINYLRENQA
ncbi:MAG: CBS domain-containing protein [Clostridia bacterium]|nr:CBS domain-containing protein [Clostridia bacterium]